MDAYIHVIAAEDFTVSTTPCCVVIHGHVKPWVIAELLNDPQLNMSATFEWALPIFKDNN